MSRALQQVSAAYTLRGSDLEVQVTTGSSTIALTLPNARNVRREFSFRIVKVDSGSGKIRLTPTGSETVGGQTTFDVPYQHQVVVLVPDPINSLWRVESFGGNEVVVAPSVTPANSYQPIAADLTLGATSGSSTAGDTAFFAPMMGNVFGTNLSKTQNYIGGGIFHYSCDGTRGSTYPCGAVLAGIGDLSTGADGAVVAYLDGDSGVTSANAAFKVMYNNSTASSKFTYGLDLFSPAHDSFNAVSYATAEIRLALDGDNTDVVIRKAAFNDGDATTLGNGSLILDTASGAGKLGVVINGLIQTVTT